MSLYDVLGAPAEASSAELRRAFLDLAHQYHPDHHVQSDASTRQHAELRMREINDAWAVLGDVERRRNYDRLRELRAAADRINAREAAAGRSSARPRNAAGAPGAPGSGYGRQTQTLQDVPRDWKSYASPGPAL